jgi:uncharacterized ion transporter superfamily protein YfcC
MNMEQVKQHRQSILVNTARKIASFISRLAAALLLFVVIILVLFFGGIALGYYLAEYMSTTLAFATVTGIYTVLALGLYAGRGWIFRGLVYRLLFRPWLSGRRE